jgi:hypothetical protein
MTFHPKSSSPRAVERRQARANKRGAWAWARYGGNKTKQTRFATDIPHRNPDADAFAQKYRKYDTFLMKEAVRLMQTRTMNEVAKLLNVPFGTLYTWKHRSRLPKTGRYTKQEYLKIMWIAKARWTKGEGTEIQCLREAVRRSGTMTWKSVKVHMCFETVPAVPGFRIYSDPNVQLRCEAYGRGEIEASSPLALPRT